MESCKPILIDDAAKDNGILMLNTPDVTDYELADSVNQHLRPGAINRFPIMVNCHMLIKRFFDAVEKRQAVNLIERRSGYYRKMVTLEKKLNEYLSTTLPSIKILSKESNMSESNLKKHFRLVFGKNIYEYYLDKKMHLAKDLIINNRSGSISAVASALGYERVAGFSKAFKNAFGVLPSNFKSSINSK
jgi:AraC-like DNA-binding protein